MIFFPNLSFNRTCHINDTLESYPFIITYDLNNDEGKFLTARELIKEKKIKETLNASSRTTIKEIIKTQALNQDKMAIYFLTKLLELGDCIKNDGNFGFLFTTLNNRVQAKPIMLDFI